MTERFLVTGATGQLGIDLVQALKDSPHREVIAASHSDLDVADRDQVLGSIDALAPHVIVHAAAFTAVDACEAEPDKAFGINAIGTRNIAEAARRVGAHVVYVSSDYVFDGLAGRSYVEWDHPNPLSVYGRSKYAGELEMGALDSTAGYSIVRTSWVCGAHGSNFVSTMLRLAQGKGPVNVVDDQWGSPTFAADLAAGIAKLAIGRRPGIWHMTNEGETTWFEFARAVFEQCGAEPDRVQPVTTDQLVPARPAPRPRRSTLDNMALRLAGLGSLPPWQDSLGRLLGVLQG